MTEDWEIFSDSVLITAINLITIVGTLLILLTMAIFLAWDRFQVGFDEGFRSLAGLLLPWVVIGFLYKLGMTQGWASHMSGIVALIVYAAAAVIGYFIIPMMILISSMLAPGVPVREVIISGVLSIMLYGRLNIVYYGVFSGLLLFLILMGFPPEVFDFEPAFERIMGGR